MWPLYKYPECVATVGLMTYDSPAWQWSVCNPEIKPLLLYNYLLVLNDNPSIRGEEPRRMIHSKVQSNPTVEILVWKDYPTSIA